MDKVKLHEELLKFLIEKKINFLPRQTNRGKKLSYGEWFLNGSDYNCFSFWEGFDSDRKVPNIALFLRHSAPFHLRLVLNSRSDESSLPMLQNISNQLQLKKIKRNEWDKNLKTNTDNISQLKTAIEDFINYEKVQIDEIVEKYNHHKIKCVTNEKFLNVITNLNKYRNSNNKLDFSSSSIIGERKKLKRKGVKSKSEDLEIRDVLSKRLEVKKNHNKLQNQLFKNLSKDHSQNHLILEENFIDLKFEDDTSIVLYEVKPYQSVNRCIKESLGQLIGYYYNLNNPKNKNVELIVAGPNEPNKSETEYLFFLKNQIKIKLNYKTIIIQKEN